ncbi:2-oxo acid dehydrogenase subunit E2 [Ruminococcus sp. CLA-AA-H200]|uniref:2-oxo acid dehydrogenase subunit E2 n=1 Tax=Ruminococcus turbiniformis TaxID=2881258 RepID=A0ABS8FWQ7_9FIRM|nr:dihydrolipoamide acetyltransferase family protein [Ruminococcus turbiniformis]MCC2254485.1 2-oxo acid dehydrogenase subunit E2 [Ruminococcus turbiniformis]
MEKRTEVAGMRKIIAERMSESWHVSPRVCYELSVDMTYTKDLVKKLNENLDDKSKKVTMNHVLMKVCAQAMSEYEMFNSSFEDNEIVTHDSINIGLAVAVDDGLIVPNVKDVLNKDLRQVAVETNDAVARTKNNRITMDDITGGTFTITNLGMMGIESFSPIINQPEAAILGVTKIIDTPVVIDGEIVIRPMMKLDLVADHRMIDGAYAAKFLSRVKDLMETGM